jgi:hypothetical protein
MWPWNSEGYRRKVSERFFVGCDHQLICSFSAAQTCPGGYVADFTARGTG